MIPRFFRRLWSGLGCVGRVYHADADTREAIEWATAMRERMEVSQ